MKAGVRRLCSGHKPVGGIPLVTSVEGVQLVVADTSYSGVYGASFFDVNIENDKVRLVGTWMDRQYDFIADEDERIGQKYKGYWVRGKYGMSTKGALATEANRRAE